jgi:hypothetical protein
VRRVLLPCCIRVPNSCVGIQQDSDPAPGQRFPATDMEIPALGRDMLPVTAAFSEPTNGNLLPGKLNLSQRFLLQLDPVRTGAELLRSPEALPVIWCLYPETIIIARAEGDPSQAVSHPEIPNQERQ